MNQREQEQIHDVDLMNLTYTRLSKNQPQPLLDNKQHVISSCIVPFRLKCMKQRVTQKLVSLVELGTVN